MTKPNKGVLLLSTTHDSDEIYEATSKSVINLDYNKTKGEVDTVDKMCSSYSTSIITKRWPMTSFFRYLDIGGINAAIIYSSNNQDNVTRRRFFLTALSFQLMSSHLRERAKMENLPNDIKLFLKKYKEDADPQQAEERRVGPCHLCGRHKWNNSTIKCKKCVKHVCKKHFIQETICQSCNANTDKTEEEEDEL